MRLVYSVYNNRLKELSYQMSTISLQPGYGRLSLVLKRRYATQVDDGLAKVICLNVI